LLVPAGSSAHAIPAEVATCASSTNIDANYDHKLVYL